MRRSNKRLEKRKKRTRNGNEIEKKLTEKNTNKRGKKQN